MISPEKAICCGSVVVVVLFGVITPASAGTVFGSFVLQVRRLRRKLRERFPKSRSRGLTAEHSHSDHRMDLAEILRHSFRRDHVCFVEKSKTGDLYRYRFLVVDSKHSRRTVD